MVCKLLLFVHRSNYFSKLYLIRFPWFFIVEYSKNDLEWMSWVQETNEKYLRVEYFMSMSLMAIVRT